MAFTQGNGRTMAFTQGPQKPGMYPTTPKRRTVRWGAKPRNFLNIGGRPVPLRGCGETEQDCYEWFENYAQQLTDEPAGWARLGTSLPGLPDRVDKAASPCAELGFDYAVLNAQTGGDNDEILRLMRQYAQQIVDGKWGYDEDIVFRQVWGQDCMSELGKSSCKRFLDIAEEHGSWLSDLQSEINKLFGAETSESMPSGNGGAEGGLTLPTPDGGGGGATTTTMGNGTVPSVQSQMQQAVTGMGTGTKIAIGVAVVAGLYLVFRK